MQSNLRKKLIQLFTEADGEFISGQKISEELGCSRTAVWKHIEDLRKSGYELEAVRKLGYKMIKKPDKITEDEIRLGLKTKKWDRRSIFRMSFHQLKKSPTNLQTTVRPKERSSLPTSRLKEEEEWREHGIPRKETAFG